MAKKTTKSKKKTSPGAANNTTANGKESEPVASASTSTSVPSTPVVERTPTPPPELEPEPEEDILIRAEKVKEQGNVAFKAKRFGDAVDLYTKAIEMNPTEPSFLTNRAAAYMGIKRFRLALDDCQLAATLQAAAPSAKTLLRLARCQFALGSTTPALSTLRSVIALEPKNAPALQLQSKINLLEAHLKNFESAKAKKEWAHARLALDKCLQGIEGEGGEIPTEWRLWRVELELARGNLEAANTAANDALRLNPSSPDVLTSRGLVLFLSGRLPQALQHAQSALRGDPGHEPAQRLRKRVKDVERLKEEGNAAFKTGKLDDAIEKYGEALDRVGDAEEEGKGGQIRATLLSNRATALLKLNRHEDALRDTDASLELTPTSFKALRTRARIHLHLEHYDQCVADFKAAIQQVGMDGSAGEADLRALKTELKKAEAALKRSKTKDYYKILGVQRDCTEQDIRKGYRRESLKHHPDKGGDEEKFKLVVEANAVLSDPQRRERYDMGEDEDGMSDSSGMGGMNGMDLSELFAQFHGGGGSFGGGFGGGGFGGGMHSHGGGRSHGSHGFGF
ncbi:protein prenylyltransferase [Mycena leptocephala]|nr:protein prenylyltransferase [Mycena leptocephala]